MNARLLKGIFLAMASVAMMISSAAAQPTATDLSYYPLHRGNVWLYKVYYWSPQGEHFTGYTERRIVTDTMLPNGNRYFVYNNGEFVRMDSTTGQVLSFSQYYHPKTCPDTNETEIMNVSVHSALLYQRCSENWEVWGWDVTSLPSDVIGELYVDIRRPRRQWRERFYADDFRYAEGIGPYYMSGSHFAGNSYYLYHARINGVDYWPVNFRSFTAAVLPGNQVHLRWRTENEIQNAGFTVQRRQGGEAADWLDLSFIAPRAGEGQGAEYDYTDDGAATGSGALRLAYRLRQLDYDGTVSYSDIVEVELSILPDRRTLAVWPNPGSTSMSIYAGGASEGAAQLLVTDLLGRELRRFDTLPEGGVLTWDLTTASGPRVPPGLYRLLLVGGQANVGRTVMVR